MNLNDFSRSLLTGIDGNNLLGKPTLSKRNFSFRNTDITHIAIFKYFSRFVGDGKRAAATLSIVFWQAITSSDYFENLLTKFSLNNPLLIGGRLILTMNELNGNSRYDLLVLTPEMKNRKPFSVSIEEVMLANPRNGLSMSAVLRNWLSEEQKIFETLREKENIDERRSRRYSGLFSLMDNKGDDFILDAINNQDFSLIFAPMPTTELTHGIPTVAQGISLPPDGRLLSSAGIFTTDRHGRSGITAALHGVFSNPAELFQRYNEQGAACVLGKEILVGGRRGIIRAADLITDSCFIETDTSFISSETAFAPLTTRSPFRGEPVSFNGISSTRQHTVITEADIGITSLSPFRQSRVYTRPVTNPGDSGAALKNNENLILGFGHRRTGLGEEIEFSEWIWADAVFHALGL
jgi:hypothetical protein